jgi:prolyl-tRNA synthetase
MRLSHLFSHTQRELPADVEIASHQLLLRAGFIRPLGTGIFTYLPLAQRSLLKMAAIMREEINAIGGQELCMPIVHPAEVWQRTGRWQSIGSEMGRFRDKSDHDMVLAMTHEEVVADLTHQLIHSYRQLPQLIYHIQTKWRDDPRPRGGLIRVREFTMLDSYSLDQDEEGLEKQYQAHYQAYLRIFERCGLPVTAIQSDVGMMGGKLAHEFMYLTPVGEDTIFFCNHCGYAANRQVAKFKKEAPQDEETQPLERVATPNTTTIENLAQFLNIPKSKTAKAVFYMASFYHQDEHTERLIFAVLRGDMEINETKLMNALKANDLRPASEDEILSSGAVPGYASPVGLKDILVVVDDLIPNCPNLVAGANEPGFHLRNVNYGHDFQANIVADIASAYDGAACENCGKPLFSQRGVEVGNIFKLGTRYSESTSCTFLDENGKEKLILMGSYGIGLGRLLACIAEEHHDVKGLCWPASVTPYPIYLVLIDVKDSTLKEKADKLYQKLITLGLDVLYDDREESPGVKFNDADLIGLPVRITLSKKSLDAGGAELKARRRDEKIIAPLNQVALRALELLHN